ncbi:MAG: UDP-N-acetylmuramoyl-L-alanine--D-glutamate ligase [Propionibacteriaceae bacterium]|jgi:UDP-N-acetylmuramoylalanine--D-glutamate ligase|nr:UDP-N-acetylmuramoyl-L-alanine--D-glutamate ligase [Propionibacteriaceae bacterium]
MGGHGVIEWLNEADAHSPWSEARVCVAGLGAAGFASADALLEFGAQVIAIDDSEAQTIQERAKIIEVLGGETRTGPGSSANLPEGIDLVIASPGWHPGWPLLAQAAAQGIPIWGDVELAWRLMHPDRVLPWLGVTGTNGKTTTTQMLASMLEADGLKVAAVGNIGRPIIEAINDEEDYDVFAVELSSFQLHWVSSVSLHSACVLNVHEDHLEWYADLGTEPDASHDADAVTPPATPFDLYARDKGNIFERVTHACVYNVAEPLTQQLVEEADVIEGARAIGFTLGIPGLSELGVVDDMLVDRAFIEARRSSALPLANLDDVQPSAPHNVENALAAAALARSFGVSPTAVTQGLRTLDLGGHRIETVAQAGGVTWVDDSKATNPHAANSSMRAYDSIVWLAGGQAKGTSFDDLATTHAARLRGAVLFGVDRHVIADALAKAAPGVPVVVLDDPTRAVMETAVEAAAKLAAEGDTVLLAPGCASKDIWSGYDERGDDFAKAVAELTSSSPEVSNERGFD